MKLYIKQRVFSWKDRFDIVDENGAAVYYVEGQLFSFGKKLHLYSRNGSELCFIHQKVFSFLPRYFVEENGSDVAEVVKKISFLKPKYEVFGPNWEVEGDFFAHEYEIFSHSRSVARISKRWLSFGDTYEIDIREERDEVLALAVVLIIDAVLEAEEQAANAANNND